MLKIRYWMAHKLKIIDNKSTWNNFIINSWFKFYIFVDSWEWWEFNKLEWQEVYRYGIFENDENLVWVFQLIKIKAKSTQKNFKNKSLSSINIS